jgi:predicted ribosome quality control (RQC) complex YloA/Tae2 family protein
MAPWEQLANEIESAVIGRRLGRIFQLNENAVALDFTPHAGSYLFIDYGRHPQIFLIVRKQKHLERAAVHLSQLAIAIKRELSDDVVERVRADGGRIVLTSVGNAAATHLELDLHVGGYGLRLTDGAGAILVASNPGWSSSGGRELADLAVKPGPGQSISSELDARYRESEANKSFEKLAADARRSVHKRLTRARRLIENIDGDIAKHGDAELWKKHGDLILANLATLRREGDFLVVNDYFDEEQRELRIPADANRSPTEAAEEYFRRYAKARNAAEQAGQRRKGVADQIKALEIELEQIDRAIADRDEDFLRNTAGALTPPAKIRREDKKPARQAGITQARTFVSSSGFEILVGKKAVDNDYLTFRIARSRDLWLHAADYPGSHVVVRNPGNSEVPQKVVHEAAQLAAFYSDAREMPKAAVKYTLRKFVQKPKRSAPGLVSLSSHKTILVNPGIPESVSKR